MMFDQTKLAAAARLGQAIYVLCGDSSNPLVRDSMHHICLKTYTETRTLVNRSTGGCCNIVRTSIHNVITEVDDDR